MHELYRMLYNKDMSKTMSMSQARANFPSVIKQAGTEEVFITVNGEREAVITSARNYESLIATLEVMSDPELVKAIEEGEKDFREGKFHLWEDVKKELKAKLKKGS